MPGPVTALLLCQLAGELAVPGPAKFVRAPNNIAA